MKKLTLLILVIALSICFIGCKSQDDDSNKSQDKLGIRGIVLEKNLIGNTEGILGSITVEGEIDEDTTYDKAVITISKDTIIKKDNLSKDFTLDEVKVGNMVEVTLTGPIEETYPIKAEGKLIRVITVKD